MDEREEEEEVGQWEENKCSECGGYMTWCEGCRMWSRTCCEQYGTCLCS